MKPSTERERVRKNYDISELTEILERIRGEIRSFRDSEDISQAEFARRAKVSKTTVNDIENGLATDLQLSTLLLLARMMHKSPVELVRESDLKLPNGDRKLLIRAIDEMHRLIREVSRITRKNR